jgi:hypothetical protein
MSYDFHLFRPMTGVDPLETARASLEVESDELNPGPPVPEKEQRKSQNVQLLRTVNPGLEMHPFDFAVIARRIGCSEAEARARYRHLELNGPEDGNGIQITLADDTISITVPYWHGNDRAEPVLAEVWSYLGILEQGGGFRTFDPQLERLLVLGSDLPLVVGQYRSVADRLPEIVANSLAQPPASAKRPWWKLW